MEQKKLKMVRLKDELLDGSGVDNKSHTTFEERQKNYQEAKEKLQEELDELAKKIEESFAEPEGKLYVESEISAGTTIKIGPTSLLLKNRIPGCTIKKIEDLQMRSY